MKNIFLVKTPLQLLNAIEAKSFFSIDAADSVLILMADRKSQAQLHMLASNEKNWGDIIDLNNMSAFNSDLLNDGKRSLLMSYILDFKIFQKSFFYIKRLNKLASKISEAEYVFVGHAKYVYMKHFSNIIKHEKTVSLDDGNATIKLAKDRKYIIDSASIIRRKAKIKLFFKKMLQGLNDSEYKNLIYFTIYNISCAKTDQVIKNEYSYIRSGINELEECEAVYFVGSPLSETGILSQKEYMEYLKRVKEYFKGKKIYYISHRRENTQNVTAIYKNIGIEVLRFEYPLEYQLAFVGPRPKILASFISSALDSCSLIFGDKVKIIAFELSLLGGPFKKEIESIYENYRTSENKNIQVENNY